MVTKPHDASSTAKKQSLTGKEKASSTRPHHAPVDFLIPRLCTNCLQSHRCHPWRSRSCSSRSSCLPGGSSIGCCTLGSSTGFLLRSSSLALPSRPLGRARRCLPTQLLTETGC